MLKEIKELSNLNGKTIVDTKQDCGNLWIKFSDNSFTVLSIIDNTVGFGYKNEEVNIYQYGIDKTEHTLVELGLISESEYKKACEEEELEYKRLDSERSERVNKLNEDAELVELKRLSEKYKTI